jgi:DNA-binding GntR family transcriptional regulator
MQLNVPISSAKSTSILIADALRSAILQGKLTSGQPLRQDEIAAEFNVSKIPVREAFVQLQAEGLIKLHPSRGAVVSNLTPAEVHEIYVMRLALEPLALEGAIPNMTPTHFMQLEHILARIDYEADLSKWAELNWEFHEGLYMPAQMPHLLNTIRALHHNVVRFWVYYLDREELLHSQAQHRAILEQCREANIERAVILLKQHLNDPVKIFALHEEKSRKD